jgi:hypothetical protein
LKKRQPVPTTFEQPRRPSAPRDGRKSGSEIEEKMMMTPGVNGGGRVAF